MNFPPVASNRTRIGRVAMLVGCLLAGSLGVAQAAPAADEVRIVVRYGDLDLSTTAGAAVLYKRIAMAAQETCPAVDIRELSHLAKSKACREAAIDRAVNAVHSTQLAALQAEHTKRG